MSLGARPRSRWRPAGVVYHFFMSEVLRHPTGDSSGSSGDPLAALRAATGSRHAWIDRSMPLAAATFELDDYRLHLRLIRQWLAPIERWLAAFDDGPQDRAVLAAAAQLPALDADLAAIDADPAERPTEAGAAGAAAPQADDAGGQRPLPDSGRTFRWRDSDQAFRWGVCYVLEGSRLGGLVLHRRVTERLAPHRPLYLSGDRQAVGERWKSFIAALRTSVTGQAAIERACAGACAAFDELIDVVTAALPANGKPPR